MREGIKSSRSMIQLSRDQDSVGYVVGEHLTISRQPNDDCFTFNDFIYYWVVSE